MRGVVRKQMYFRRGRERTSAMSWLPFALCAGLVVLIGTMWWRDRHQSVLMNPEPVVEPVTSAPIARVAQPTQPLVQEKRPEPPPEIKPEPVAEPASKEPQAEADPFLSIRNDAVRATVRIEDKNSQSSGVIVGRDKDRLLVVCSDHGVDSGEMPKVWVWPYDKPVTAEIVKRRAEADVCLLWVPWEGRVPSWLKIASREAQPCRQAVMAAGCVNGQHPTTSVGQLVGLGRLDGRRGVFYKVEGAKLDPGASGGPLVNTNGRLIGIRASDDHHVALQEVQALCDSVGPSYKALYQ